ncbi:hypothetical protein LXA43DRAFT_1065547 [Ganoderma leucocontextum]|nr:hypothetical protein LXA43DRAFT_1065547 [Ganoderma leucocontextum]
MAVEDAPPAGELPVSDEGLCRRLFVSTAALVLHLESGTCASGMTRTREMVAVLASSSPTSQKSGRSKTSSTPSSSSGSRARARGLRATAADDGKNVLEGLVGEISRL